MKILTNQALSNSQVFQELCKASGKWGLNTSFDSEWYWGTFVDSEKKANEIALATNRRLVNDRDSQCVLEGWAIFVFDTEK